MERRAPETRRDQCDSVPGALSSLSVQKRPRAGRCFVPHRTPTREQGRAHRGAPGTLLDGWGSGSALPQGCLRPRGSLRGLRKPVPSRAKPGLACLRLRADISPGTHTQCLPVCPVLRPSWRGLGLSDVAFWTVSEGAMFWGGSGSGLRILPLPITLTWLWGRL